MTRLHFLSSLLACLAVLATAAPIVAWAGASSPAFATERLAVDAPRTLCSDCEGAPCTTAANSCIAVCFASPPTLGVMTFTLATPTHHGVVWPTRISTLLGLTPALDPLPPRA
jgi:hypothetical protein